MTFFTFLWQKQKTELWNVNSKFGKKIQNCDYEIAIVRNSEIWDLIWYMIFFDHICSEEQEEETDLLQPSPYPTLRPSSRSNFQPESGIKRLCVLLQEPNMYTHTHTHTITLQTFRARFTKPCKLAWGHNPIKAPMGVESSVGDLWTIHKIKNTNAVTMTNASYQEQ